MKLIIKKQSSLFNLICDFYTLLFLALSLVFLLSLVLLARHFGSKYMILSGQLKHFLGKNGYISNINREGRTA